MDYYDDDEAAEAHRHAAALIASLLMAENDHEHHLALQQAATLPPGYLPMLIIGSLAGIIHDLLDQFDWEEYSRLEWVAQRVDVLADCDET